MQGSETYKPPFGFTGVKNKHLENCLFYRSCWTRFLFAKETFMDPGDYSSIWEDFEIDDDYFYLVIEDRDNDFDDDGGFDPGIG